MCRRLLALFIVVALFLPLAIAAMMVLSVGSWAFDRGFYEDLLGDERLYDALLNAELPNYINAEVNVQVNDTVLDVDNLPARALSAGLREIVTPEYLREQSLAMVDDLFDFFEGRDALLEMTLDLAPLKERLLGEQSSAFAAAVAGELPTCASGQEPLTPGAVLIRCIPEGVSVEDATRQLVAALPNFVERFPDRLELVDEPVDVRGVEFLPGVIAGGIAVLVVLALVFWIAAGFIASPSNRERLFWLGGSLFVPAFFVFILGLGINTAPSGGWISYGLREARVDGAPVSDEFEQAVVGVGQTVVGRVANGFLMVGGVSGGIALALIAVGWGMRPADADKRKRMVEGYEFPDAPPPPPLRKHEE